MPNFTEQHRLTAAPRFIREDGGVDPVVSQRPSFAEALRQSNEAADRLTRAYRNGIVGAFLAGCMFGALLALLVR